MPVRAPFHLPCRAAAALLAAVLVAADRPAPSLAQDGARQLPPFAVAIITHRDTPADNLAFAELQEVFLGHRKRWPRRMPVTLLVRRPEASEREMVLRRIYHMSEAVYNRYWMGQMLQARVLQMPSEPNSSQLARAQVAVTPGAITFVPARQVRGQIDDVKVLRIDGKLPGDPGYRLQ